MGAGNMSVVNMHGDGARPPGRGTHRFLRSKRTWGLLAAAAAAALGIGLAVPAIALADLPGGCDFSSANNGNPDCLGPLAGSTFAGGDRHPLAKPPTLGPTHP